MTVVAVNVVVVTVAVDVIVLVEDDVVDVDVVLQVLQRIGHNS